MISCIAWADWVLRQPEGGVWPLKSTLWTKLGDGAKRLIDVSAAYCVERDFDRDGGSSQQKRVDQEEKMRKIVEVHAGAVTVRRSPGFLLEALK
jgi:hypothetical protein